MNKNWEKQSFSNLFLYESKTHIKIEKLPTPTDKSPP